MLNEFVMLKQDYNENACFSMTIETKQCLYEQK